ncbi:uncharacterized protein [Onthophagus taurus]|uniref:uncharacterized protein n=1 Tax=Onthophagus taurus TaxID=166361 RepID=UPI000C20E6BD|nr:uncharacterized protein LOC111416528 [Onthophagus taurus]
MSQLKLTTYSKMKHFGVILFIASTLLVNDAFGNTNCDFLGLHFYKTIGCKVSGNENGCPSYNGCQYSQPIGHCTYQGQKINNGQDVKDVVKDSSCNFGCICTATAREKGKFRCAPGNCGEVDPVLKKNPKCFLKHSLDKCCPKLKCGDGVPATCKVGNEIFKEGQIFRPKNKCLTCICTKDFDGKLNGPNCQSTPCDIEVKEPENIEKNCAPLYVTSSTSEALCCPSTFVCPSSIDIIKQNTTSTSKVCKYGLKTLTLGSTIETENNSYGQRKVHCKCIAPPLMTCTMSFN